MNCEASHDRLKQDYFTGNLIYGDDMFWMWREMFLWIVDDIDRPYFRLSWNARGKMHFSQLSAHMQYTTSVRDNS